MTLICSHRVNDPDRLRELPSEFGVEMDLRTMDGRLVVVHDAFSPGPDFDDWLDAYHHSFIVVNIKEEGLENEIRSRLDARGITEWAFLDESFPYLVRTLREGDTRTMVRVSEFEKQQTALALTPRPDWVWLDSFTGSYPEAPVLTELADHGFQVMVVSPELQGRDPHQEVATVKSLFEAAGVPLHGVCTKQPELWA